MLIAIPSKGRAGKVRSIKVLRSATLFVPDYEAEAYKRIYGDDHVVAVPNDVKGITATRNWILDNAHDDRVVMLDDDVKAQGWFKLYDHFAKHYDLSEPEWIREFTRLFEVCDQTGYRIWGVATDGALMSVYPFKPFLFRTYVTASCMGIRNETGIRFDERFRVKEDYEICLRCIKEDGGLVGARYIHWVNSHWGDEGGCKDYRTVEIEEKAVRLLMQLYPGYVSRIARKNSGYNISLNF